MMMPLISTFSKFQLRLLIFCLLIALSNSFSSTPASDTTSTTQASAKPILVVGATGRVGRIVVNQLLEKNQPVRALIRNTTKAQKLFGANINGTSSLELITADLGHYDDKECAQTLERAVIGCDSIISVSGTLRFSKLTDFLPWRLLRTNVTSWCNDDRRHPYYPNYQAQVLLINLAAKYNISRFVRVTGLSVGLPAFNPVSILFSGLLSMTSRYHALTEQYLRSSAVPYVILRPGGLTNSKRVSKMNRMLYNGVIRFADVSSLLALLLVLVSAVEQDYHITPSGRKRRIATTSSCGAIRCSISRCCFL